MDGEKDANDAGLAAFVMLLHFHGVAADAAQIRHRIAPGEAIGVSDMARTVLPAAAGGACATAARLTALR